MGTSGYLRAAVLGLIASIAACGDEDSAFEWTAHVGRDDGPGDQGAMVIAVDSRGNSAVMNVAYEKPARVSKGVVLDVSRVRSLDASGHVRWQRDLGLSEAPARAVDLTADGDDNIVVLGEATSGRDWIARIDRDGKLALPPTTFDGVEHPSQLAVDADGNVFVVGATIGEQPNYPSGIAVAKLSADGELLWMHAINVTEHEYATALAVDSEGGVLVGADIGENTAEANVWFQRYDKDGVERWSEPVVFETEQPDTLAGVAILPDDSFLSVGSAGLDGLGPSVAWLMHYGADGVARWPRPMLVTDFGVQLPFDEDAPPAPRDRVPQYASADAVALDPKGHPVVIGVRNESVWLQHFEPRDGILDPCGGDSKRCNVPTIYERGNSFPNHRALAIDKDGRVLITGDRFDDGPSPGGVWLGKLADLKFSHAQK